MISDSLHIGASALQTFSVGMQVTAHNLANCSTQGFSPQHVTYSEKANSSGVEIEDISTASSSLLRQSGTDIATELSHMASVQHNFEASAKTVATVDEMAGVLLNIIA